MHALKCTGRACRALELIDQAPGCGTGQPSGAACCASMCLSLPWPWHSTPKRSDGTVRYLSIFRLCPRNCRTAAPCRAVLHQFHRFCVPPSKVRAAPLPMDPFKHTAAHFKSSHQHVAGCQDCLRGMGASNWQLGTRNMKPCGRSDTCTWELHDATRRNKLLSGKHVIRQAVIPARPD
jgi:hypothetical protein